MIGNGDPVPVDDEGLSGQLRQPPGLYLLFLVEMWERFSYYGMRALLVLYLIKSFADPKNPGRGWTEGEANLLYGWYTGLAYLLPVGGGYLADKFLGTHRSMVIGAITIALGHIVLALSGVGALAASALGMTVFITGLALIIVGTGFFKPCVSVMVGQLFGPNDPRRDGAFTIFYMGINLGAFLCAFVCGTLGEKVGWHWGFGAAAVGMLAGLGIYLLGRSKYLAHIGLPPSSQPNWSPLFFSASLILAVGAGALYHSGGFASLANGISYVMASRLMVIGIIAMILMAVIWFIAIQDRGDKGPTACIFIFIIFNAFFWLAAEQGGSTLNVFAEESTDRFLFNWEVPATWFQSVNPLIILLFAPIFAGMWSRLGRLGRDPSQPVKIGLGLLLLGAGFVFMVIAARSAQFAKVSMFWLLANYFLVTLGELAISPTGLSFVTKAAPARFVSLLMGIWFISSFLANLGGGLIASKVQEIEKGQISLFWYPWFKFGGRADYFFVFVISSVGAGLVILFMTPLLKRMLHGRG